jgi:hypothetical protein
VRRGSLTLGDGRLRAARGGEDPRDLATKSGDEPWPRGPVTSAPPHRRLARASPPSSRPATSWALGPSVSAASGEPREGFRVQRVPRDGGHEHIEFANVFARLPSRQHATSTEVMNMRGGMNMRGAIACGSTNDLPPW